MRFGILGSGFGLYGYLPALLQEGHTIILPERYRSVLLARADLRDLSTNVDFVDTDSTMIAAVEAMVLAVRPLDQEIKLPSILAAPYIRFLLLEKPLAPDPSRSAALLSKLQASGVAYRIGYTLLQTRWARRLAQTGLPENAWSIEWRFEAHHYVHDIETWKREAAEGGGALRFYGIHLVALLAAFGYESVTQAVIAGNSGDCSSFSARLSGPGIADCTILVDSRHASRSFHIFERHQNGRKSLVDLPEPFFEQPRIGGNDVRVGLLMSLMHDLIENNLPAPSWYGKVIDLWSKIEASTNIVETWSEMR